MLSMKWIDDLSKEEIEEIGLMAKDWAFVHGITMRTPEAKGSSDRAIHTSFTMFPSPVPRVLYQQSVAIQQDFNLLMFQVAHDHEFLQRCLENVIKADEFTRGLWNIYETVRKEGVVQPYSLGLFRNDFMLHTPTGDYKQGSSIKQVEFNTIASSMAGFAKEVTKYHRFLMSNCLHVFEGESLDKQLPQNNPAHGLAGGLVKAWELYGNKKAVILFIIEIEAQNAFDQRHLDFAAREINPSVKIIYRHLAQVNEYGRLTDKKCLMIDDKEVAVVYFRAGYSPDCHNTQQALDGRLLIERSTAIKCPSINFHLAGAKKVQQELCKEGVVERYIEDPTTVRNIRASFMGQYSLDLGAEGDRSIAMALENPENFVVKPQREGGGNNLYGHEIVPLLTEIRKSEERNAYILMELIKPLKVKNVILKSGAEVAPGEIVGELGIYSIFLGKPDNVIENHVVGHMVRSKFSTVNEGGVAVGAGCIDSPLLID